MTFRNDLITKLSITDAVYWRYGKNAKAEYTGPHAYNIQANVNGQIYGLDLLAYVRSLAPASCPVMSCGVDNTSWSIYNSYKITKHVIPIIVLTNETRWNIQMVKDRVYNLKTVLIAAQEWLRLTLGKTWSMTSPVVLDSNTSASQINTMNEDAANGGFRYYNYFSQIVRDKLGDAFDDKNCRYLIVPIDLSAGSSSLGNISIVQSAVLYSPWNCWSSLSYANKWDVADNITTVIHELLHTFGLDDSYKAFPNHPDRINTIMGITRVPQAILLNEEKEILDRHAWLT